jgi:hypothetical protein
MQHCVFVAVAQQMSISDERTSRLLYRCLSNFASTRHPPKIAMESSGRISDLISLVDSHFFFSSTNLLLTFPQPTQPFSVSQCRNSSISWALVSALLVKSPHLVNQHRKPQLHVQSQEMQVMDLILEAIFRQGIKTVRNMAAEQTTKTTHRSLGATIQENASTTTARKRTSELVKRNGIHKTQ